MLQGKRFKVVRCDSFAIVLDFDGFQSLILESNLDRRGTSIYTVFYKFLLFVRRRVAEHRRKHSTHLDNRIKVNNDLTRLDLVY